MTPPPLTEQTRLTIPSQLKPADRLTLPPSRTTAGVQGQHRGLIEIWPWIVLAALAIVVAEWLAFHRGL